MTYAADQQLLQHPLQSVSNGAQQKSVGRLQCETHAFQMSSYANTYSNQNLFNIASY